jgi:O-antigen/teichoic acid export membrane protein
MGVALLTMSVLESFSATGFHAALIQKKENITSYLDAAWTILVLRGFVLFLILYGSAPYVALFFKEPEAEYIIRVVGISILFHAVTNLGVIYFRKELEFRKLFIYQLSGTVADFLVAVSSALIFRSVWALVFGLLAGNAVRCFVSYRIHPYKPRLSSDLQRAKELFGFGKWVLASSIMLFLITQGDDIVVGKFLGVTMLGFYQLAYIISNAPATEITHVISQVIFPAYAKLQDQTTRLRKAYLKVLQVTLFFAFPVSGLLFILASDFTKLFLGEKWMPMVPAMQVLVFAGLVRSIAATTGHIFYAVGSPKIDTRWQIIRLLVMIAFIYPFTMKWGILGTSVVVFLSILIASFGFSFNVIRIIKCKIKDFSKIIIIPMVNGIMMVTAVFFGKNYIGMTGIPGFIVSAGIGMFTYLAITYIFSRYLNYGIFRIFSELKNGET